MVKTASTMLPLGTACPEFSLEDVVTGRTVSTSDFAGKPLLVMFICNHCPYVIHLREGLSEFSREFAAKGLEIVGVMSNDADAYPDDSPEAMKAEAESAGYAFPYLYDETQSVAKAFTAACTPDFFLFDSGGKLVYRGRFDSSRRNSDIPVTGEDLRKAAAEVLAGTTPPEDQIPSLGCNIKWKPDQEPSYFTGLPAAV